MVEVEQKKGNKLNVLLFALIGLGFMFGLLLMVLEQISGKFFLFAWLPILIVLSIWLMVRLRSKDFFRDKTSLGTVKYLPEHEIVREIYNHSKLVLCKNLIQTEDSVQKPIYAGSTEKKKILHMKLRDAYDVTKFFHYLCRYDNKNLAYFKHNKSWTSDKEERKIMEVANSMCEQQKDMIERHKRVYDPVTDRVTHEEVILEPKSDVIIEEAQKNKNPDLKPTI